ncbi:MAG: biotin--[acetyl-CoA-carboxylase] ligase [Mariprofundaceae bacterium]|nr:biotin--[acetyl-CoA-carboxylase] ligase [Mariprofundaceae bacterium]
MTNRRIGHPLITLPQVDSTNTLLLRMFEEDPSIAEGTTLVAEQQTSGRGRRGRSWFTAAESLACSVLLKPSVPLGEASTLTLVAAVAVHHALAPWIPNVRIKWPNDLLVGERKLCGILTESRSQGGELQALVVGIGLNISAPKQGWPDDIATIACSVNECRSTAWSRDACLQAITASFDHYYTLWQRQGFAPIRQAWQTAHAHQDQAITIAGGVAPRHGIARGLDHDGALLLETNDGIERVICGEVHV